MIVITTSRKPSQRTRSFVNDLARVISGRVLTRGKTPLREILNDYPKIILVEEYKGNPGKIKFYDNIKGKLLILSVSVKLQREVCNKEIENIGCKINMEFFGETIKYKSLFYDFFEDFGILDRNSSFRMSFEGNPLKNDNKRDILFYIQFYKDNEKVGPLIIVKSLKILNTNENINKDG
ncbi:MAG TPA: ribosomal biogenesis protein [Methanothermococcus okinawensis]|uniref:Probable Brix domain-containing ribosomal biogenesis protein n=1 Tax=Methanothermococcus okinawensis TaxID=155863 RepID=A0A833DRB2_9EURY|nr:ribosomal biogenesis protein [Methanothermococcus okinawensis]